jgi:hypothetical protein
MAERLGIEANPLALIRIGNAEIGARHTQRRPLPMVS